MALAQGVETGYSGHASPARPNRISSARKVNRRQARLRQIKLALRRIPPRSTQFSSLPADHASCQDVWLPGPSGDQYNPLSLLAGWPQAFVRNPPRDRFLLPPRKRPLGLVLFAI